MGYKFMYKKKDKEKKMLKENFFNNIYIQYILVNLQKSFLIPSKPFFFVLLLLSLYSTNGWESRLNLQLYATMLPIQ